ncbi:MAG: hypothetical protein AUG51_19915 [Acidobacteria bacterium 13_1_20CM_3_53_8]|nr:MAG: hypothetical protein AUG51_19915 [Acidobacteria bacterium 13_1_20CM_3_53_8]
MADKVENQANQEIDNRAGGNLQTKGGSQPTPPPPGEHSNTRAGGNLQTKGASGGAGGSHDASKEPGEINEDEKSAGGDR